MNTFTESQLRDAFVNASKGEAKRAMIPDLDQVDFSRLDYFGWQDAKKPRHHYVALELDGEVAVLLLRGPDNPPAKKMLCAWCEDIVDGVHAASFVAPLAGASGRRGNTVGTAICADCGCSANARRPPSLLEMSSEDPEEAQFWIDLRIEQLRERCRSFVENVMRDDA